MDLETLDTQYKLFHKYWYSGSENDNPKDFQTADQLRGKIIPQIESLLDADNRIGLSDIYADFAEFLFEYFLCLNKLGKDPSNAQYNLRAMAEKAIELNPDSFPGHYFLAVYHSWNLKRAHAGDIPAIHKGEDAATSIVGTAFNLLFKGVTLGATATAAGISKSTFTTSVQNLIVVYRKNIQQTPLDARYYIKITSRMFNMADYCEDVNNRIWRDIYLAIKEFDPRKLDYSELEDEVVPEAKETVMEFRIVADSKL